MEAFFNWIANPGPTEEITIVAILVILMFGIPFWLKNVKIAKISKEGVEFQTNEIVKIEEKKETPINRLSIATTQDYKLFVLILRDFYNKIEEEIKTYCRLNGLNKKNEIEYKEYVEDKKLVYYSQLKEIFQNDYISYDIVTYEDVENIVETLRDFIFNKIDTLYKKIREISINEHNRINDAKDVEREMFTINIISNLDNFVGTDEEKHNKVSSVLDSHYKKCKEIMSDELISIIDKQTRVIDEINKSITRRFIEEFENVYRENRKLMEEEHNEPR